ncbi:MAG: response regulator, partial [Phycicoccus sp.]
MIRVLVVDDDFMVARIHVGFVERVDGFEVAGVARSGAEATRAVASLDPDLLLLDLYLPDRFGLDLLADLRTGRHPCDAVVITAAKESEAVRAAVRLGVADYLLKPFGFADLEERLVRYASRRARIDAAEVTGQADVDRLLARSSAGGGTALPKGISPETARLVAETLAVAAQTRSASQVADDVGLSRVSAR